jgi:hypothetical protein
MQYISHEQEVIQTRISRILLIKSQKCERHIVIIYLPLIVLIFFTFFTAVKKYNFSTGKRVQIVGCT